MFSDGVLDVHPELETSLDRVGPLVTGTETAGEMVDRLLSAGPSPDDDVTVVALRRRAPHPVAGTAAAALPAQQSEETT